MIALSPPNQLERIKRAINGIGGTAFIARETDEGTRVEC
jgi:hypothetical protein